MSAVINPAATNCLASQVQPFAASGFAGAVTWSTDTGTITQGGVWTAPGSTGTSTITATDGTSTAHATATVYTPAAESAGFKRRHRWFPGLSRRR